jgi:hypothetical protein
MTQPYEAIPIIAITLGILGVGLPTALFSVGYKWAREQRDLAAGILAGMTIISFVSVAAAALIVLVLIGWIPPLDQLLH